MSPKILCHFHLYNIYFIILIFIFNFFLSLFRYEKFKLAFENDTYVRCYIMVFSIQAKRWHNTPHQLHMHVYTLYIIHIFAYPSCRCSCEWEFCKQTRWNEHTHTKVYEPKRNNDYIDRNSSFALNIFHIPHILFISLKRVM